VILHGRCAERGISTQRDATPAQPADAAVLAMAKTRG